MKKASAQSRNTSAMLLRQTLSRLGHKMEDIDTVLKNHEGSITFAIAKEKLLELKKRKKYELVMGEDIKPLASSAMIVISSESEDSSDEKEMDIDTFKTHSTTENSHHERIGFHNFDPLKLTNENPALEKVSTSTRHNSDARTTFPANKTSITLNDRSVVQMVDQFNDTDVEMDENLASFDMPTLPDLYSWFNKNYQVKFDGVVLKQDLFEHFVKDFKTPSYPELEKLFFENIQQLLYRKGYDPVEIIEDKYFDGLEKTELPKTSATVTDRVQDLLRRNQSPFNQVESDRLSPKSPTNSRLSKVQPVKTKPATTAAIQKQKMPVPAQRRIPKVESPKFRKRNTLQNLPGSCSSLTTKIQTLCNPREQVTSSSTAVTVAADSTSTNEPVPPDHALSRSMEDTDQNEFHKPSLSGHAKAKLVQNHTKQNENDNVRFYSTKQLLKLPQTDGDFNLRPIVIDGSNIACSHGNGKSFSCRGIALCVRYFWLRGHRMIFCFVPHDRKNTTAKAPIVTDREVLFDLEAMNICKFTPSRKVNGKWVVSYDDRFILDLAAKLDGVVVSNDQYRDLINESRDYQRVIENSLLPYVFAQDFFMPASDPLGRHGPDLDDFLRFSKRASKHTPVRRQAQHLGGAGSAADASYHKKPTESLHTFKDTSSNNLHKPIAFRNSVNELRVKYYSQQQRNATTSPNFHQKNTFEAARPSAALQHLKDPLKQNEPEKPLSTEEQLKALFPESKNDIDRLLQRYPDVDDINWFANLLLVIKDSGDV